MSDYDSVLKLRPAIPEIRDPPLGNYNRRSRVRNRKSHSPDWESVVLNPRSVMLGLRVEIQSC